jgi:uncharacterized protein (TIGR00290 family)
MSWSSGKDSAYALHVVRSGSDLDVAALLTTVNSTADRVAMHAVRRSLLEAQAERLGLPLVVIDLPWPCPNEVYETRMAAALEEAVADGVEAMVFGDLFLEDVRAYRVDMLAGTGIEPVFPLWGRPTDRLAREIVAGGVRATLTCVDPRQAPRHLVGRAFDGVLLDELPDGVDPCGERGEFHSFAWDTPDFTSPIPVVGGDVVERDGFVFADLVPA